MGKLEYIDDFFKRPCTRAECCNALRPCPWVGCPYHLYLDINPCNGNIKFNFVEKIKGVDAEGRQVVTKRVLDVHELTETCALDIADRGGHTLQELGELLNVTRERIRQIEEVAKKKLRRVQDDMWDEEREVRGYPPKDSPA